MSVIDMNAIENIKSLQEKTGKNLLEMLVNMYVETTPEAVEKMQCFLKDKLYEDLGREAHSLKSSSANVGAKTISELCKKIEYKALGKEEFTDDEMAQLIADILRACPETFEALGRVK